MRRDAECAECAPGPGARGIHPLAVLVFCPHCVLTGVFAAAAAGLIALPSVFGIGLEWLLPPVVLVGGFLTWIWWGRRGAGHAHEAAAPGPGALPPPQP